MSQFDAIVTKRLVLRKLAARDRTRLIELANNWRVARNLATMPYPYTGADADAWLANQDELWSSGKAMSLAITAADALIGGIGMRIPAASKDGVWELGYWLGEPYWNRGYASEAAAALCDHFFTTKAVELIAAGHYADNHASGRVLAKTGFRYTREAPRYCLARKGDVKSLEMVLHRTRWLETRSARERQESAA